MPFKKRGMPIQNPNNLRITINKKNKKKNKNSEKGEAKKAKIFLKE